jgi:hypothetical protein
MDDIFNTLNGVIPPKYLAPLTALFVISQVLGRMLQAIRAGGGLRSIILGVWFGTNTKTDKQEAAKDEPTNNKLGLFLIVLICGLFCFGLSGCAWAKSGSPKLAAGGAYAQTAQHPALPELYVLDASFDLAQSALTVVFNFERDNRKLLWGISPDIKHSLDKLRREAKQVATDYAIARAAYLANPFPENLGPLTVYVSRLQSANAAALAVLQTKGIQ